MRVPCAHTLEVGRSYRPATSAAPAGIIIELAEQIG
jgi:hypothetical protein